VIIRGCEAADRWAKAKSYKAHVYGDRESHNGIVPAKRSNEGQGGPKEIVEGRLLTKEKEGGIDPSRTRAGKHGSHETRPFA
jgi:hypothetical protein